MNAPSTSRQGISKRPTSPPIDTSATVLCVGLSPQLIAALSRGGQFFRCVTGSWSDWPDTEISAVVTMSDDPVSACSRIRELTAIPLCILTTAPTPQRTAALALGADLCISPTDDEGLVAAQIGALLRRQTSTGAVASSLQLGAVILDPSARTVTLGQTELTLAPREFDLLAFLMRSRGRAFRRHELLDAVWGRNFFGEPGTIDVHISWLRQKLPAEAGIRITTVRGIGYRLDVI